MNVTKESLKIVLDSFACDKACPFCIAKTPTREAIGDGDNLDQVEKIFAELSAQKMKFHKFIVCSNGEPSLYPDADFGKLVDAIKKYQHMFGLVRVQTSGNL